MSDKAELIKVFAKSIQDLLSKIPIDFRLLQEIRLRINGPLILNYDGREMFVTENGSVSNNIEKAYLVNKRELMETMEYIGNYSLYAFEDEIRQGFITGNL